MANQPIATVVAVIGKAFARNENGELRALKAGDTLLEGETVITYGDGRVELSFVDGSTMEVAANQAVLMTADLFESGRPDAAEGALAATTAEQILQALAEGRDIDTDLEAPAAGVEGGGDDDGNNFVRLLRITEGVDPLAFEFEGALATEPPTFEEGLIVEGEEVVPVTETEIVAALVGVEPVGEVDGIYEGGMVVFTATLSQVSSGDITITLSNGVVITIPAGELSASSDPVPVQGDDPYVDPSLESVHIVDMTGGGVNEVLNFDETPMDFNVEDTTDTVTVRIISNGDVKENEQVGFTVSVDTVLDRDLTVNLDNGDTVVIAAGETSVGYTLPAQGDDVYVDPEAVTVGLASATVDGAEFENLVLGGPATVNISDTPDQVTATLSTTATEISETGGSITYTITLTGPAGMEIVPKSPLTFDLANGEQVTIAADQTTGFVTREYTDAEITTQPSIQNSITGIYAGGSEYEDLQWAGATLVDIDYGATITGIGAEGGDHTVYENDLPDGTSPDADGLTKTGSFTIGALDGIASLQVGGTLLTYAELSNLEASNVVIDTIYGALTLTGYVGNEQGGTVSYSYTLDTTVDNDSQAGATDTSYMESVQVIVTDTDDDSSSSSLNISIIDDTPYIVSVTPAVIANEASGYLTGQAVFMSGADTPASADLSTNVTGWDGTTVTYSATDLTSGEATVYYYVDPADTGTMYAYTSTTASAYTGADGQALVFTLTVNPVTGAYVLDMHGVLDAQLTEYGAVYNQNIGGNQEYLLVTDAGNVYKPGATIPINEHVIMTIDSSTGQVNSSQQGLANASQWVGSGVSMQFMFAAPIIDVKFSVDFKSLSSGQEAAIQWTAYGNDANGDPANQTGTLTIKDGMLTEIPTTLTDLTRIDLTGAGTDFRVSGSEIIDRVEQGDIDTTFKVVLVDADGDSSGETAFAVHFEGSNELVGSNGNDAMGGSDLSETLIGGEGNDILTGGLGADTFVWNLGDQSATPGDPAQDTVTDFTTGQNDVLDLSDLLQGADQGSLASYLHFEQQGSDIVVVHISTAGDFDGSNHGTVADQVILLENFSMGGADSANVIQQLIDSNNLIISNG